jgi:hypothetical protein
LGLAFQHRKHSHRNGNVPVLAILLRGTILTDPDDIIADLPNAVQTLNESDRVLRTVEKVVQVLERYLREAPIPRQEYICMAGYSLGAAIALPVGGTLYSTHEINIDTHLFNPPLVSVVNVLTGRALPKPTALADSYIKDVDPLKVEFADLIEVFANTTANGCTGRS